MVIRVRKAKAFDDEADGRGLRRAVAAVLHVQVVDDRGHAGERRVREAEGLAEHLERAESAAMRELDAEHVEGHGIARRRLAIRHEPKTGTGIDESLNQPR